MVESINWPFFTSVKYSLTPIQSLLKTLGNPEKKIPFPVHIVGTNGKGSTLAFLSSILSEAGYKVNSYTSPNLVHLNERIKICGTQITDAELLNLMSQMPKDVSFFEAITASAFCAFAKSDADVCLIEAGLGGRLDATNVINPKLCILTSVSLDHTEVLGETPLEIAKEKLAVQKEAPFIIAKQPYDEVIDFAKSLANTIVYGRDFEVFKTEEGFTYKSKRFEISPSKLSLYGQHQIENASNAIAAAELLKFDYGFKITKQHIESGLQNAVWSGRFEKLTKGKAKALFPHLEIFIDGAHNENGIERALKEALTLGGEVHIICGFLKRKNLKNIAPQFKGHKNIHITEIHSSEISYSKEGLEGVFVSAGVPVSFSREYFWEVLSEIKQEKKVLILGSLYLIGEVLKWNYGS